jgi:hypothetical protein
MKPLSRKLLLCLLPLAMICSRVYAADISITAANVVAGANATIQQGMAGATITAGQVLYMDPASNTLKLCNAMTSTTTAQSVGIALNGASSGQPISYQIAGDITIGGTIAAGVPYFTSANNSGGVAPFGDLTTGWYPIVLGIGKSTTVMTIINKGASTLTAHL